MCSLYLMNTFIVNVKRVFNKMFWTDVCAVSLLKNHGSKAG